MSWGLAEQPRETPKGVYLTMAGGSFAKLSPVLVAFPRKMSNDNIRNTPGQCSESCLFLPYLPPLSPIPSPFSPPFPLLPSLPSSALPPLFCPPSPLLPSLPISSPPFLSPLLPPPFLSSLSHSSPPSPIPLLPIPFLSSLSHSSEFSHFLRLFVVTSLSMVSRLVSGQFFVLC